MIKKFLILVLFFLLSPLLVEATIPPDYLDYLRSPTGDFITTPVNFYVTFDNATSVVAYCGVGADIEWWGIVVIPKVYDTAEDYFYSETMYSTTTLTGIFSMELPFEKYQSVASYCKKVGEEHKYYGSDLLEHSSDYIFEVGYYWLPLQNSVISNTLAYAGYLFTDLKEIIILVIGLPIGFWFVGKVIGVMVNPLKK